MVHQLVDNFQAHPNPSLPLMNIGSVSLWSAGMNPAAHSLFKKGVKQSQNFWQFEDLRMLFIFTFCCLVLCANITRALLSPFSISSPLPLFNTFHWAWAPLRFMWACGRADQWNDLEKWSNTSQSAWASWCIYGLWTFIKVKPIWIRSGWKEVILKLRHFFWVDCLKHSQSASLRWTLSR